ncbi:MAG TPA: hypothetical protein VEB22_08885 [Phycisphaerales bacterium]|nr:hypothetical protein [Phycisphaerales bacterium]
MSLKVSLTSRCSRTAIFADVSLYPGMSAGDERLVARGDNAEHQTPL